MLSNQIPTAVSDWVAILATDLPDVKDAAIFRLAGDGSSRSFFRIRMKASSLVLLWDPEWTTSQDYEPLQKLLSERSLPVPKFIKIDKKNHIILMEDLGDELLQLRLKHDAARQNHWLKAALVLLADFHGKLWPLPEKCPALERKFDTQKYFDELLFTEEHLSEKFLGMDPLGERQRKELRKFCETIANISPSVICHRDYHSRNLLVSDDKLFLIDFQDARLGSPHYDLASFVFDPYLQLSWPERLGLVSTYRERLERYPNLNQKISGKDFHLQLLNVGFQRVVKAMGSFASFYNRFQKKTHLPYLAPALQVALKIQSELKGKTETDFCRLEQWKDRWEEKHASEKH